MKIIIVNGLLFLLLVLTATGCASQVNLAKRVSESRNTTPKLSYLDSSGNGYERGLVGGMPMKIVFKNVEFNKKTNLLKVEGVATAFFDAKDTVGLCCVDYFIAQPLNGYLTKIRKLGKTNSNQVGQTSRPDGYFSIEINLAKQDRLYFVDSGGIGLEEYNISIACSESSLITKENPSRK